MSEQSEQAKATAKANEGFTQGMILAVEAAVKGGADLNFMVAQLDRQKFRLQMMALQIENAMAAKQVQSGIVLPNGHKAPPFLPPPRG